MIQASCHCGNVRIVMDGLPPDITECNCSICRRYGVLWAYYSPAQVIVSVGDRGADCYMWDDRSIEFRRCRHCGCVTHWAAVDPQRDRMGVNARLIEAAGALARLRVRHLDGAVTETYLD